MASLLDYLLNEGLAMILSLKFLHEKVIFTSQTALQRFVLHKEIAIGNVKIIIP